MIGAVLLRKTDVGCAAFLASSYAANAVYQGYIGKLYQQLGVESPLLPWLLTVFPLAAAPAQLLWGWASDRTGRRRGLLRTVLLLSLLILPLYRQKTSFAGRLAVTCAFALCYPAVQPFGDSLILKNTRRFGPVRLAGTLAFACSSLLAGRLFRNDYGAVPLLTGVCLTLTLAATLALPDDRTKSHLRLSPFQVLRLPHMLPLLSLPILLFSLPRGLSTALWALGDAVAVQQIESVFLSPRLMSGATGLHPAYVLLLLSAGGLVAGLTGMLLFVCVRGAVRALQCANQQEMP